MKVINSLESLKDSDPDRYSRCSFQLDAMSIRRQISYDAHTGRMFGFVDIGSGDDNSTEEAKEALVFMLVGIQGYWKIPIAYFLTNTLTAAAQKELVILTLQELEDRGFEVIAVTMDGHASNMAMCQLLGGSLNVQDPRPYFTLPDSERQIFIIIDPCHVLKLFRNTFASYGDLYSDTGVVSWSHITELHALQETSGLRAGNKLSSKHIGFHSQKMKVSLAAQTLSNSVAKALRMAHEIGYQQFDGVLPTVELLEVVDRLFDILNSRNPRAKGYKAPISHHNCHRVMEFLATCRDKLLTLQTMDLKFLHDTKRYQSDSLCILSRLSCCY